MCAHGCFGRRRARPPARLGNLASLGAAPRSPPWPSGPSGALHTSGARCADDARRVVSKPGQALPPPTGTAADPSGALHTSGARCADDARRVGLLFGQALSPPTGTAAWPWTLGGAACVAVILGRSATRCYKRRQSEQLFVWSPEWLLQTSSIHRLFR